MTVKIARGIVSFLNPEFIRANKNPADFTANWGKYLGFGLGNSPFRLVLFKFDTLYALFVSCPTQQY